MATAKHPWEHVADGNELADGDRKSIFVDDVPGLLVRLGDQYFAIEDQCTHDGQPLTDGKIKDGAIVCPRHGARFELATGRALCMPATEGVQTFAVQVRSDGIYVKPRESSDDETPVTEPGPTIPPQTAQVEAETSAAGAVVAQQSAEAGLTTADAAGADVDDGAIIEALRQVIDPELMINIVDLGLIYSVNHSDRKAVVEMTLTSPACPAGPQIVSQARMVVERLEGIDEAQIKLTMSPPWSPERMTDEARDQLGFF